MDLRIFPEDLTIKTPERFRNEHSNDLATEKHDCGPSVRNRRVPRSKIADICSGRSLVVRCSAKTVFLLAKTLDCTMEDLLTIDNHRYDQHTGLPKDRSYPEKRLPEYLQISLDNMKRSREIEDSGERDMHGDLYWCELYADINSAEVDRIISAEQADYLRKVYLRIIEED